MNVVGSAALKLPKAEEAAPKNPVNLYNDAPNYELSLDEFEVFALKRLKVCHTDSYVLLHVHWT